MVNFQYCENYGIDDYVKLIEILRSEDGCPWDRAQTHESIRRNLVEEALEAAEAIDEKDTEHLKEELGDLLMQVVFHAQIEREHGSFDFNAVCDASCRKLLARHPHVFGDAEAADGEEALKVWEAAKRVEHGQKTRLDAMRDVAATLPATWRMEKLIKRAEDDCVDAETKLTSAVSKAVSGDNSAIGSLVFEAARLARSRGLELEELLAKSCEDYISSFEQTNL